MAICDVCGHVGVDIDEDADNDVDNNDENAEFCEETIGQYDVTDIGDANHRCMNIRKELNDENQRSWRRAHTNANISSLVCKVN